MKEKLNTLITVFTRFSTVIFLLDSIALLAFKGKDASLSALDVLVILGIALICGILYVLILSDKNVSKKKNVFASASLYCDCGCNRGCNRPFVKVVFILPHKDLSGF